MHLHSVAHSNPCHVLKPSAVPPPHYKPRRCKYLAEGTGASISSILNLVAVSPSLLIKSPAAVLTRITTLGRVLGVGLPEAVAQAARRPELLSRGEGALLARLSERVMKEVREANEQERSAGDGPLGR